MITITFNSSFATGDAFTGTIGFQGKASLNDHATAQSVTFGGSGGTIQILPNTALTTAKTSKLNADDSIDYQVTVAAENGTSDTVTIADALQTSLAKYEENSFSIVKKGSDGTSQTVSGYSPYVTTDSDGKQSFSISGLPKLGTGESYVVSYKAQATVPSGTKGDTTIGNSATGSSGSDRQTAWSSVTVPGADSMLRKSGTYDPVTQKINWTITVRPNGTDLTGWTFEDACSVWNDDTQSVTVPSTVTVTDTTAKWSDSASWATAISWMSRSTDTYQITYQTDVPSEANNTYIRNNVKLNKDGTVQESAYGDVWVSRASAGLEKTFTGSNGETADGADYWWNTELRLPTGIAAGSSRTYTDVIENPTMDNTDQGAYQYGKISDLEYHLSQSISGSYTDNYTIQYYNAAGNLAAQSLHTGSAVTYVNSGNTSVEKTAFDAIDTHILKFVVTFTPTSNFTGSAINLGYGTTVDYTKVQPGETWRFSNRGSWDNYVSEAHHDYTKKVVEKQSQRTVGDSGKKYLNSSATLDYDASSQTISYRVLILTEAGKTGDITLRDWIPEGTALIPSSVHAAYHVNDNYEPTSIEWYSGAEEKNYVLKEHLSAADAKQDSDGNSYVDFTIGSGYAGDGNAHTIALYYQLSIKDDSYWKNLKNLEKTYTNKIEWGSYSDSQTTTVHREVKNLSKTGAQVMENGNLTNRIRYTVAVNPAGNDLAKGSDVLTLKDTLTAGNSASVLPDTISLYRYDVEKADHIGEKITGGWLYTYDDLTHTLSFTLPDSTPCIVTYEYAIDRGATSGDISVSNSASLQGSATVTDGNTVSLKESSSYATAARQKIVIYKVDANDYMPLTSMSAKRANSLWGN